MQFNHNSLRRFTVILIMSFVMSSTVFAQSDLITALNNHVIPIRTLDPEENFEDLRPLDALLRDKRIIGLGEATHGTQEFSLYKDRMIRYLITNHDFRTIILEADFTGTQFLDDYVVYGKGSIRDGIEGGINSMLSTPEFIDMVKWIKTYNETKPMGEKVRFYGCDMQHSFFSGARLKDGTIKLDVPLSPMAQRGLAIAMDAGIRELTKEMRLQLDRLSFELARATVVEPDPVKQQLYTQIKETVIQQIAYKKTKNHLFDKENDIIRDKYMAENAAWIYHQRGNKTIIWAHNLHVAKDIAINNWPPMGSHLAKMFPHEYYVFGFAFNAGQLNAGNLQGEPTIFDIPDVTIKKSSDYQFKQVNTPNFILDFKTASQDPLIADFLNKELHARAIGARYKKTKYASGRGSFQALIKLYDAIIFFRDTHPITIISVKELAE